MNEYNYEEKNWERLLADIERHRGKKRLKKVGKGAAFVVAAVLIINFSLGIFFTTPTEALRSMFLNITRDENGQQIQYSWLPKEKVDEMDLKLEDKDAYLPEYLPPGYELDEFEISSEGDYNAKIRFINDNDIILRLTQRELSENEQKSAAFPNAEKTDDIEVNGNKGIIAYQGNDYITVFFVDHRGIEHVLNGKVSKEELINIAESIN